MKKHALLFFLCLTAFAATSLAQEKVSGKIIDGEGMPIAGVNCQLSASSDSVRIAGTVSNVDGYFELPAEPGKTYILALSFIGFIPYIKECPPGDLGVILMQTDARMLEEAVVTPQILSTFGNKDQILLTESTRRTGTNALDAIGSLPQFRQTVGSSDLTTVDNKTILVLIDGIRASSKDLMHLQADNIKHISYYSNPPARYAHENIGAVIDVTTQRKKEQSYRFYLDTKTAMTTGYGTETASFVYADSLNRIAAVYFVDFRNVSGILDDNSYSYGSEDRQNDYAGVSGRYKGAYHIGQVSYQRYARRNLFNAKIEYRKSAGLQEYEQNWLQGSLTRRRSLASDYTAISADLYYMRNFNGTRNLSFNILNTHYVSGSDNIWNRETVFQDHAVNRTYSLIAEVLYCDKFGNGDFRAGGYFQYKNLDQTYNLTNWSRIGTYKEYAYADFNGSAGKFSYSLGAGLENSRYEMGSGQVCDYFVFRPSVILNLQVDRRSSLRFSTAVKTAVPSIGDLTDSRVTVDASFFRQGNPELKPYHYYSTALQYQFSSEDGKLYLSPAFNYSYNPSCNRPVIFKEGDILIQRLSRLRDLHEMGAMFSLSYKPAQCLTIRPYYNYIWTRYDTPNQSIDHGLHNYGTSFLFMYRDLQTSCHLNFPLLLAEGDLYRKLAFNASSSILYKFKSISAGLTYIYAPTQSYVYATIEGFRFSEKTRWNAFEHRVDITFTYAFSKGKSRSHADKRLSNTDNDSGLTETNTAK